MNKEPFTGTLPKEIDSYLLALRWGIIVTSVIVYWLLPASPIEAHTFLLNPRVVFSVFFLYNAFISFYSLRERPIALGRPLILLFADTVMSLTVISITGGHLSAFFLLFFIVIIEAALAFKWHTGLVLIVLLDALQIFVPSLERQVVPPVIVTNHFVAVLVFGIAAIVLGAWLRREEMERRRVAAAVRREHTLNEIFFKLGQSGMSTERLLSVLLEGIENLIKPYCAVIALYQDDVLKIAVSTSPFHPNGEVIQDKSWLADGDLLVMLRSQRTFTAFVKDPRVQQLIIVSVRSATRQPIAWIVMGFTRIFALTTETRNLMRTFGLEAGLALHNAYLYQREQEHVQALERFSEMRANFFSALSHELKTPLTVLKTLSPALERLSELPPETQQEVIASIQINLERLDWLINELFESLRLEAKMVVVHPVALDLARRTLHNIAALRPVFKQKGLTIETNVPNNLPSVLADPRRYDQILGNLLHNAIKFSPEGGKVRVSAEQVGPFVQICVDDAGPGIPKEDRRRIFDKFTVVPGRQASAGVGLGLFISRELVRLHGGKIWVEKSPLGGSRFCFTLPLAPDNPSHHPETEGE